MLTADELGRWQRDGYLVVPDLVDLEHRQKLRDWADTIRGWNPRSADVNPLIRQVVDGRLAMVESAADHHDGLGSLLRSGSLVQVAAVLLREPVVLHSDSLRYAVSGDLARQWIAAARYIDRHLGCVVAIDPVPAGRFEVAGGCHGATLPSGPRGDLDPLAMARLPWTGVTLDAGSTLWLHRRAPHRMVAGFDGRILELTYSARVQGDLRAASYVLRRRAMGSLTTDTRHSADTGVIRKGD